MLGINHLLFPQKRDIARRGQLDQAHAIGRPGQDFCFIAIVGRHVAR
jgi:hypothetical protein